MNRLKVAGCIVAIGVSGWGAGTAGTAHAESGGNSAAAHACQRGGYASYVRSDGTAFANTGECVSYAAHGGVLQVPQQETSIKVTFTSGPTYYIGGPAGSNFTGATVATLGGAQVDPTAVSSAPPACTGYLATFSATTTVTIHSASKTGDTVTCTLQPGLNLIGDPFVQYAALPAGWTGQTAGGTSAQSIPPAGALLIDNMASLPVTITLTAQ